MLHETAPYGTPADTPTIDSGNNSCVCMCVHVYIVSVCVCVCVRVYVLYVCVNMCVCASRWIELISLVMK